MELVYNSDEDMSINSHEYSVVSEEELNNPLRDALNQIIPDSVTSNDHIEQIVQDIVEENVHVHYATD
jgi:division protein CdvB (Snf7/Vps24/ESCRT-III family)